jgi:rod shape-determining protein MreD
VIAAIVHSSVARLVPVGILVLALQKTLFAEMRPAGVALQLMLAFAAAAGAVGGPERGMVAGFTLGLMYDLGAGTPLGSSAATMGVGGLVAGTVAFINIDVHWWLAAIFVAFGAAVGELLVPVVRTFIGETDVFTTRLYKIVPVVALSSALMSPIFVPVSRWCLRLQRAEWKTLPE